MCGPQARKREMNYRGKYGLDHLPVGVDMYILYSIGASNPSILIFFFLAVQGKGGHHKIRFIKYVKKEDKSRCPPLGVHVVLCVYQPIILFVYVTMKFGKVNIEFPAHL